MSKIKHGVIVESITKLDNKESGLTISVWRGEDNANFDHNLNAKVMKEIAADKHDTLYNLAEALLKLHRVNAVEVRTAGGNGVHLIKDYDTYPVEP